MSTIDKFRPIAAGPKLSVQAFKAVYDTVTNVLNQYFNSDRDVMSDKAKRILSNDEDSAKYMEALKKIREGSKRETIVLSNQEQVTLVS